jgi:hypothetical protein
MDFNRPPVRSPFGAEDDARRLAKWQAHRALDREIELAAERAKKDAEAKAMNRPRLSSVVGR